MVCAGCGTAFEGPYCPACGSEAHATAPSAGAGAGVELRAGAYLIDLAPAMLVSFYLNWLPSGGTIAAGVVLLAWWLLRDITGASLGKRMLGLRVVRQDGGESSPRERILRNVTLIGGPISMLIPMTAAVMGSAVGLVITIIEMASLVMLKRRLGDMLAGTAVIKK
jgi:uncharacterized RDD family membrane protein YckC